MCQKKKRLDGWEKWCGKTNSNFSGSSGSTAPNAAPLVFPKKKGFLKFFKS
jgi:hypothetical protein